MKITTLDKTTLAEITQCFNHAFSDYFVPFKVNENYLRDRWKAAEVDYQLSAGVIEDGKLVGFIVNGIKEWNGLKSAFNCATGVIPPQRGNQLTQKMYDFFLPKLKAANVKCLGLEVIQENEKAIHIYKKAGLKIQRSLNCYSGAISIPEEEIEKDKFILKKIETPNWDLLKSFYDCQPAWESNHDALKIGLEQNDCLGVFSKNQLLAYAFIKRENGYVAQFGVHPEFRQQGIGKFLFYHISKIYPTIKINNVDAKFTHILKFITKVGLKNTVNQYEMVSYL